VGLRFPRFLPVFVFFSLSNLLNAAPVLRLVTSTVGPVNVAQGAAAQARTVEAYNAGDGTLLPTLTSSVPWISTAIGTTRPCMTTIDSANCIPLQLTLNTAALGAGTRTGIVTVSDPNAADAPQTIVVVVRVGAIDAYVAPDGTKDLYFTTTSPVATRVATQSGGSWLSVALDGTGSFRFDFPYRVRLTASDLGQGTYSGSVTTSGGAVAPDNQTIPVTMRVTEQPIASVSPESLSVRLAQGAPPQAMGISVANTGLGTLTLQGAVATGMGITASAASGNVTVTLDPASIAPGVYDDSVAIMTNAANGTVTVPVRFEVVAKGAPAIDFQGVVDNATFTPGGTVSPGDIVVVKGGQFSFGPLTVGKPAPLATEVGGAQVLVNGKPAPMYYSSYAQLAFQMPVDTPLGTARVQVQREGQNSNVALVTVEARAPQVLRIGTTTYGAIQNAADYSIPMPANAIPGVLTHPAKVGDTLLIYAIGLGVTDPPVATGDPAPGTAPLATLTKIPSVVFGSSIVGVSAQPFFAGLAPTFAGLYQINVTIPQGVLPGTVDVVVSFGDYASDPVQIVIE